MSQSSIRDNVAPALKELMAQRVLVLDGAWGTMLQDAGLTAADYRGDLLVDHPRDVTGDPDLLSLTRPDMVLEGHRRYLAAGADITSTNTFTATRISQADYGLEEYVHEMNLRAAQLARQAADEVGGRFVAGSVGPMNVTLSLSPRVDDPAYRAVTFEQVKDAYAEQIAALAEGGVDLLLIETIFDTLNAKAALAAAREVAPQLPLWISVTIVDLSGRTLSGQTVEAFWRSIERAEPLVVGVNCSLGAAEMRPHVAELARLAGTYVACHPNAGLPNAFGGYDQTPEQTAGLLGEFARSGMVNIVGGCCGTSPTHISAVAGAVAGLPPRKPPAHPPATRFSGLEPFAIGPDTGFVMIGERTNVTGSARFRRLIEADDFQGAVAVALDQVRGGANLLDVNMDADLLDSEQAMTTFLNLIATEPEVARIPVMIDSSRWSVLAAGLTCVQGKAVVNSISLKEGVETFLEQARYIRDHGAGVVVMAFDERGQADTTERKVEICARAYDLLVTEAGFAPEDIIFDPNVLAVATGIAGAQRVREGVPRRTSADQAALSGCPDQRRHLQPVLRVPGQRGGPRGDALGVPVPRRTGRARHGHRQRRSAGRLREHPDRPARPWSRTCCSTVVPTPPTGWCPSPRRSAAPAPAARWTCPGGRPRWPTGWSTRWCTASSSSSRPTPRRRSGSWAGPSTSSRAR